MRLPPTVFLDVVDSTNSWLRRKAREVPAGTAVAADYQTAGRGRGDRRWHSPPGGAAMFSLLWPRGEAPREELGRLSVGLARTVAEALAADYGVEVEVKPPNDVLAGGKKLCGILIEECGDRLIVGVGVNTNLDPGALPEGVDAASLSRLCGSKIDNRRLIERLVPAIAEYLSASLVPLTREDDG